MPNTEIETPDTGQRYLLSDQRKNIPGEVRIVTVLEKLILEDGQPTVVRSDRWVITSMSVDDPHWKLEDYPSLVPEEEILEAIRQEITVATEADDQPAIYGFQLRNMTMTDAVNKGILF